MSVDALTYRTVDLREYVSAGSPFEEGSLQVVYYGKPLQLGAQVRLVDDAHSLIFDEQLTYPSQLASTRLEGVWSLPTRTTDVRLVLSNRSAEQLSLTARVDGRGPESEELLTLLPHETRVLDLTEALKRRLPETGGISIEHSGPVGGLMGRVLISDTAKGYSAVAELVDPAKAKSSRLQGAGLRLSDAGGKDLTPVVVARNVGATATTLTGRVVYTNENGSTATAEFAKVPLRAGQVKELNLTTTLSRSHLGSNVVSAGLEFEYTGSPGNVIMSTHSIGKDGNQVFRVPMLDPSAQRSSTGGYPLIFEGDSSTLVYLKNTTDRPQRYVAHLKAAGVPYIIGQKMIEPGQTVTYDVRSLRDNQVPDENGNTLPLDATRGHFKWSVLLEDQDETADQLVMIGRAEHFDTAHAMSSSYACASCCPDSTVGSYTLPIVFGDANAGEVIDFDAVEVKQDCYGDPVHSIRTFGVSWSSSDPEVATVDGSGTVTTHNGGEADIEASFTGREYYPYSCPGFETDPRTRCGSCALDFNQQSPRQRLRVKPVITSITPSRGVIGRSTGVTITGRGFGSNPSVIIDNGSANGVTYSGSSGSTTQLTGNINAAANATGGNHTVQVSNKGQRSSAVNFFVQIPTLLHFIDSSVFSGPGILANGCFAEKPFGFRLSVTWQVLDQADRPIEAVIPVRENLLNGRVDGQTIEDEEPGALVNISGNTDADGTFVDAPVGGCATGQFGVGTFEQQLFFPISPPTVSPVVRINNWAQTGRQNCGNMTNGVDVSVSLPCPP
jgi:hypothetical protein